MTKDSYCIPFWTFYPTGDIACGIVVNDTLVTLNGKVLTDGRIKHIQNKGIAETCMCNIVTCSKSLNLTVCNSRCFGMTAGCAPL